MGAYLSEPITKKISSDESGTNVAFGASSMQGWRVSQEDAHNCCIDYGKETSLFAVYDGHGGHEVALYCADELPRFIKNTEAYKAGNIREALIDAFLGFDATLTKPNIIAILKQIALASNGDKKGKITFCNSDDNNGDDDDESLSDLRIEAAMPLEQVIARYHRALPGSGVKEKTQVDGNNDVGAICLPSSAGLQTSSSDKSTSSHCNLSDPGCSSSASTWQTHESDTKSIGTTNNDKEAEIGSSSSPSNTTVENNGSTVKSDFSKDSKIDKLAPIDHSQGSKTCNDTVSSSSADSSTAQLLENGRATQQDDMKAPSRRRIAPRREGPCNRQNFQSTGQGKSQSAALYNDDDDDDDDDEESDETFDCLQSSSDDDIQDFEDVNHNCSSSTTTSDDDDTVKIGNDDDDDDDEEEEEDDDDDDDDDNGEFTMNMTEEPGSDSGCTAVVAILHSRNLYVANAGDSRCVLCRDGEALELSLDHKPEDEPERERIVKAGGKVTGDGRVNGGLNLSRAIGDHAYKQNTDLPAHQQMISALPDIRQIKIEPGRDEFMILACDGIWNFMSSHEVVEFVRTRLANCEQSKISSICEELFDHCLASDTHGDGTGCDNMTAVIVKFNWKDSITADSTEAQASIGSSKKRPISPENASTTTTSIGDKQLSTDDSPDISVNKDSCKRPKTDIA